jgi:hypothetical protein
MEIFQIFKKFIFLIKKNPYFEGTYLVFFQKNLNVVSVNGTHEM